MSVRRFVVPSLTVALFAVAPYAHSATPNAVSAELTLLQVQLTDLTPNDDITPFLTAAPTGYIWSALQLDATSAVTSTYIDSRFALDYYSELPVGSGDVSFNTAGISATAERDSTRLFSSLTGVPGAVVNGYAWWETYPSIAYSPGGDALWTGSFLLGPGTELTFTANYSIAASLFAGNDGFADAQVMIRGTVGSAIIDDMTFHRERVVAWTGQEQAGAGSLSITLSNSSDAPMPVFIGADVYTRLQIAAVPEPSSLALLMAGGLLVGWRIRHARS